MKPWFSSFRPARIAVMFALCGSAVFAYFACKGSTKPEKLSLSYSANVNAALVYVALEKGFFAREGLDVEATSCAFGKLALQNLLDGKADVCTVADTPVALSIIAGDPVMIFASIQTSSSNEGIVARADRGIEHVSDLRGKRLGVTFGTTTQYVAYVVLLSRGVAENEVTFVNMNPADMPEALASGQVDAVATWNPTIETLRRHLGKNARLFGADLSYTETMCVVAQGDWLKAHPEAERRFLRALVDASAFIRDHDDEARVLVARLLGIDRSILDSIWGIFTFRVALGQGFLVDLEDQARWLVDLSGKREAMPDFLAHFDTSGLESVDPGAVDIIH